MAKVGLRRSKKKESPSRLVWGDWRSAGASWFRDERQSRLLSFAIMVRLGSSEKSSRRLNGILRVLTQRDDFRYDGSAIHTFVVVVHQIRERRVRLNRPKTYGIVASRAVHIANLKLHALLP